jgi:hypothetical protein
LTNSFSEPKSRSGHFAVSAESDTNILGWITSQGEKKPAVTRTDINNHCREVCNIEVRRGWVNSFISRHSAELIEKKSSPQEEPHLQVSQVFLDETVCSRHDGV